jgi:hypothetical protein
MSEENAKFTELGRIVISDKKSITVSSVEKDSMYIGITINSFITSVHYTGYARGVFVPADKVAELTQLINTKTQFETSR